MALAGHHDRSIWHPADPGEVPARPWRGEAWSDWDRRDDVDRGFGRDGKGGPLRRARGPLRRGRGSRRLAVARLAARTALAIAAIALLTLAASRSDEPANESLLALAFLPEVDVEDAPTVTAVGPRIVGTFASEERFRIEGAPSAERPSLFVAAVRLAAEAGLSVGRAVALGAGPGNAAEALQVVVENVDRVGRNCVARRSATSAGVFAPALVCPAFGEPLSAVLAGPDGGPSERPRFRQLDGNPPPVRASSPRQGR